MRRDRIWGVFWALNILSSALSLSPNCVSRCTSCPPALPVISTGRRVSRISGLRSFPPLASPCCPHRPLPSLCLAFPRSFNDRAATNLSSRPHPTASYRLAASGASTIVYRNHSLICKYHPCYPVLERPCVIVWYMRSTTLVYPTCALFHLLVTN